MKDRNLSVANQLSIGLNQISDSEPKWFAVYTRFKSEKFIVEKLIKKGINAYVPLLKFTRKYASKTKQVELPLISCYVFVKITKSDYIKVLQTEHVIQFLKLNGELISIPEKEMEILKWVVGESLVEKATEGNIKSGTEVEVIGGNLTGLRGKVVKKQNKKFFLVSLESIGYSLEVNISIDMLQEVKTLSSIGA